MSFKKYELFKSSGVKIDRKIIYWFCFLSLYSFLALLIVFEQAYFSFAVAALLLGAILFWKTQESLVALIFYLPFQLALNVSDEIDLASSRVIIVVLAGAWVIKSLAAKKMEIPKSSIAALILIFAALAALSAAFSDDPSRAFIRVLYFLSIIPLYFISAAYLNSLSAIKKVFGALAASAVLAALLGIAQFFGQFVWGINAVMDFVAENIAPYFYGQSFSSAVLANPSWLVNIGGATYLRAIALFPDPHIFAFYLGLVIPLTLGMILGSASFKVFRPVMPLVFAANIILFSALVFTFSRAGYIGAAFGVATVFALNWKFLDKKIKLGATVASLIIAIGFLASSNPVTTRFFAVFNLSEGSNSERLANWSGAVKIIENNPLTGVGVGMYALAVDPRAAPRSPITAHNTYLDIAAEMGIFGLLAWLAALGVAIKKLIALALLEKQNTDDSRREEIRVFALGLAGSLVWFSAQAIFDTAIYSPTLLAMLMVYLAIAVNLEKISQDSSNLKSTT